MNLVTIKLSKFIPGTLQCLKLEEYFGKTPSERTKLSAMAEVIAKIDLMGNKRKQILVFTKNIHSTMLAKSIFHKKKDYYYGEVFNQRLFNTNEKNIIDLALKSKISIFDSNIFNLRTVYREVLNSLKDGQIEVVVLEGIRLDTKKRNKLIKLAMRAKCQVLLL